MKFVYFLLAAVMAVSPLMGQEAVKTVDAVRGSVKELLERYPQATLQDIYKNNFQDYFGPAHIMADKAGVLRYLNRELAQMEQEAAEGNIHREEKSGGERYYTPCGWRHNYYQVSLWVIKDGLLTVEEFADAFMAGGGAAPQVTREWLDEWEIIKSVVREVAPGIEGYDEDAVRIDALLKEGNYVVHHSKKFEREYCPHYRIIRGDVFENVVLPKILVEK